MRQWLLVGAVFLLAAAIGLLGPRLADKAGGAVPIDPDQVAMRMDTRAAPVSILPMRDAMVAMWPGSFSAEDIDGRFEVEEIHGIEHVPGKVGTGFSATDQSAIILKGDDSLRLPKFTVHTWLNAAPKTRGGHIATLRVGPSTNFDLSLNGPFELDKHGTIRLGIGAEVLDAPVKVNDGKWHHVAATFDGTYARIHVDGVEQAQASRALRLPPNIRGVLQLASVDANLDEIGLHERALSTVELKREVRAGNLGLVRTWTGDEARPGNFSGTIGYEDGRFGFGYRFGGHGHVEVPRSPALHLDRFTLAAWVKTKGDVPHHYAIFAKENHHCGAPWSHRNFYLGISPKFIHGGIGVTFFAPGARIGAKADVADGKWHHIALSYDGTEAKMYVDAKEIAKGPVARPPVDDRQELWLGAYGRVSRPLQARMNMDDAAVFDHALSSQEIALLANPEGETARK
jgi:hypothetical protein